MKALDRIEEIKEQTCCDESPPKTADVDFLLKAFEKMREIAIETDFNERSGVATREDCARDIDLLFEKAMKKI